MAGGRKNVLWVDDEIEFLRSHIMFLETRGYSVVPVFGGDEALQLLRDDPRRFDIVLLDEQMPGKDGLTTLEEIKEILPDLPVVMVTKSEEEQVMETALGMKIDGYLTKPVNPSQILSVCKSILDSPRIISSHATQRFVRDYSENRALLAREMHAADWVRLYHSLVSWDLDLEKTENEGLRQNHSGQKSDCAIAFARYLSEHYTYWLRGERRPPVLSPQVLGAAVAPLLKQGARVRFVVLDCMRLDQYLVMEGLLKRYFEIERRSFFSILPTAPQYARAALFGGAFPRDLAAETPQLYAEGGDEQTAAALDRELLKRGLARCGAPAGDMEYARVHSAADASELLDRAQSLADRRLIAVAVDFFQMLTHGRSTSAILKEITADESSLRALTLSWFQFSPVLQLLREFAAQKATVVLTTDHGSMLCNRGIELYGAQQVSGNPRYAAGTRITSDERRCVYVSRPEQYRLPDGAPESVYLMATENCYFTKPRDSEDGRPEETQNAFCYGGISMDEVIAPLAVLTPRPL